MVLKSTRTGHSEINLTEREFECRGDYSLIQKVNQYRKLYGPHPKNWPIVKAQSNDDILINEVIQKIHGRSAFNFSNEELCHCRSVPADKVAQSIKQGCRSAKEISRATRAGTGCGTCVAHIEGVLADLLNQT